MINDARDPETIGNKILELRKANPGIPITQIADLVMSPFATNGQHDNGQVSIVHTTADTSRDN